MQMTKEQLLNSFEDAIKYDYIVPFFQAQFNHSTKRIVGAEALMRWIDPVNGIQYPNNFIPLLEEYDLITKADIHIFECVCKHIKKLIDNDLSLCPISINLSRHDIIKEETIPSIEEIRKKYNIPVELLHLEITESAAIGGMELMKSRIEELHKLGYLILMDDFGSGYSSLNVLKDLEVDVLKLDMAFLANSKSVREGIIISSVVSMAKWLDTPVIVEGVETIEQADYIKSIGCNYIQGYLYHKPTNENDFIQLVQNTNHDTLLNKKMIKEKYDPLLLLEPNSESSILFSKYFPAACIFTYNNGNIKYKKVNQNYLKELSMNLSEKDLIGTDPWQTHTKESKLAYEKAILECISTKELINCKTWRYIYSDCCGEDMMCIDSNLLLLSSNGFEHLILATISNITKEVFEYEELKKSEQRFRAASEHANMYAWEYDITTKEMRPCFRCQRDLGLPPLLKNYPEPAIEKRIFQPDYADMYRDWHKRLENGEKELEAIMPLTDNRVLFRVKYTNVFDETGRPLKAYGSATLVVDGEK